MSFIFIVSQCCELKSVRRWAKYFWVVSSKRLNTTDCSLKDFYGKAIHKWDNNEFYFIVTLGRVYPFQARLPGTFSDRGLLGSVWLGSSKDPRRNQWKFIWRPACAPHYNRWTHDVKVHVFVHVFRIFCVLMKISIFILFLLLSDFRHFELDSDNIPDYGSC